MSLGLDREERFKLAVDQAMIYKDMCQKFSDLNQRYVKALKRAIEQRDENLEAAVKLTGRDFNSVKTAYNMELENILAAVVLPKTLETIHD